MERSPSEIIKQDLIKTYVYEGLTKKADRIFQKDFDEPIFNNIRYHKEEEPVVKEINYSLSEIEMDTRALLGELVVIASKLEGLMSSSRDRMDQVDEAIAIEEERLEDLNMLCGEESDFSSVKMLGPEDFTGTASFQDGHFLSKIDTQSKAVLSVVSVEGNGYEGNEYVIKDSRFIIDSADTSRRSYMVDDSFASVYEYSRLSASKKENNRFAMLNYDDKEAECTVTLEATRSVSSFKVESNDRDLLITSIRVSDDNITYREIMSDSLAFNNKKRQYQKRSGYIFGTGVLSIPSSRFIRISFRSDGKTEDKIAFVRVANIGGEEL